MYTSPLACNAIFLPESPNNIVSPQNRECFRVMSLWSQRQQDHAWLQRDGLGTWSPEKKCLDVGTAGVALPKLGALCKVMSRITLVPKQDHIKRNCWATFFRDPCLLAATYKRVNGCMSGWFDLHLLLSLIKMTGRLQVSKFNVIDFLFLTAKIHFKKWNLMSRLNTYNR